MKQLPESDRATKLLTALRQHILNGGGLINGYAAAARMIDLNGADYGRHLGQVVSRIDLASFNAGLPFLTLHWIREPNGEINSAAFHDSVGGAINPWLPFEVEMLSEAASHQWTPEDFERLQGSLDKLSNEGARALWAQVERQIMKKGPSFIRHNLHRRLRSQNVQ